MSEARETITARQIWRGYNHLLIGAALFGVWAGGYFLIGNLTNISEAVEIDTWLDRRLPLRTDFVWFYLTIYPIFLIPFFTVRDRKFFHLLAYAYLTVMIVCYATFLTFPIVMVRPPLQITSFSDWALSVIYNNDPPVNCFPSMHVGMATIAALAMLEINRPQGAFLLALTLLIGVSTLLTKQHYIADIVVAMIVAVAAYYIYFKQRINEVLSERLESLETRIERTVDERIEQYLEPLVRKVVAEELEKLKREKEQ